MRFELLITAVLNAAFIILLQGCVVVSSYQVEYQLEEVTVVQDVKIDACAYPTERTFRTPFIHRWKWLQYPMLVTIPFICEIADTGPYGFSVDIESSMVERVAIRAVEILCCSGEEIKLKLYTWDGEQSSAWLELRSNDERRMEWTPREVRLLLRRGQTLDLDSLGETIQIKFDILCDYGNRIKLSTGWIILRRSESTRGPALTSWLFYT